MWIRRFMALFSEELGSLFQPRLFLINRLPHMFAPGSAGRIRATLYRGLGINVGQGTLIGGALTLGGQSTPRNLCIGANCYINEQVYIDAAAPVHLGDRVSIGHHVVIITSDHKVGSPYFRAGSLALLPVEIGDGSWIAAGVTILPGVSIGAGAVVAAGAVVTQDVADNTLVGGVPARLIRVLDSPND